MASNITAQSVLAEISQSYLECPICSERFKQPKLLECSHSFCLECLQKLKENRPRTARLSCPVCRHKTLLKENGIHGLKTNFSYLSLLEDIEKQETQLKQQEKQSQGQEHHSKCSKHTDKDLIMYCDTCSNMICTTCIVRDHQFHSLMEINEALDKYKQHATEFVAKVTQGIKTFDIAIQEIDISRKRLDAAFAATNQKISRTADKEIEKGAVRIRLKEKKLMHEAKQIYKDRIKTLETARAANYKEMTGEEHKLDNVNQLIEQKSTNKNVHHIEQVLTHLKEYREMKSTKVSDDLVMSDDREIKLTKVSDDLTYMNFKEGQKSLGRLVLQYTMTLKIEMKKYMNAELQMVEFSPWDAAAYSNGDIVVSDLNINSLIAISPKSNPQSTVIPQALSVKGLTKSSRVTVNKNDELIVLDSQGVKIFNTNYRLLHHFTPGTSGSNPSCVAVYENTLIAVGYYNKDEITLHKSDGSLVKTLPAPGIGGYLSTCRGRLVYINCGASNKLVSIHFNGDIVFSVNINHPGRPYGVCCDTDGSVYLAVWNEGSSGEIHHYSPGGTYIGCVIKNCSNPWGMTLTPAGDLVVAAGRSVQIYHCC